MIEVVIRHYNENHQEPAAFTENKAAAFTFTSSLFQKRFVVLGAIGLEFDTLLICF